MDRPQPGMSKIFLKNYPNPANGLLIGLNIKSAGERFAEISYTKFDPPIVQQG
jgi:hypothetical protein